MATLLRRDEPCGTLRRVIRPADPYYTLAHGALHWLLNVKPAKHISAERDGYDNDEDRKEISTDWHRFCVKPQARAGAKFCCRKLPGRRHTLAGPGLAVRRRTTTETAAIAKAAVMKVAVP
jgi:hypothetical protein